MDAAFKQQRLPETVSQWRLQPARNVGATMHTVIHSTVSADASCSVTNSIKNGKNGHCGSTRTLTYVATVFAGGRAGGAPWG
jgi:hypothetical protein